MAGLVIGENSTHWFLGRDHLLVLRCCKETYFVLFNPCLALWEVFYKFRRKKCFVPLGRQVDQLAVESRTTRVPNTLED